MRAFNAAFKAEKLGRALHATVMRFGAAQEMKQRQPAPDEPRIETPQWALDRATEIAREIVAGIRASGVRVVGDLDSLALPQVSRLEGDALPDVLVPPEIAARMAMGILVATGGARGGAAGSGAAGPAEPSELARVPTYQVVGVVAPADPSRDRDAPPARRAPRHRTAEAGLILAGPAAPAGSDSKPAAAGPGCRRGRAAVGPGRRRLSVPRRSLRRAHDRAPRGPGGRPRPRSWRTCRRPRPRRRAPRTATRCR